MSNTTTTEEKAEESNATITVELEATIDILRQVDQDGDYVGKYVRHVDHFDDYTGTPQILICDSRKVVVHKRFERGNPNLDAYTTGIREFGPTEYFDREIVEVLDIPDRWNGPDWEVTDWQVTIIGSSRAWRSQVVTWCSERPDETANQAIDRFRGWDDHSNITIAGIPEQFDVSLPWNENGDDGGDDEQSDLVPDGGQEPTQSNDGVIEDESGNRREFSRRLVRVPTPLGAGYRLRVFVGQEKMHPQMFADRVEDGIYTLVGDDK